MTRPKAFRRKHGKNVFYRGSAVENPAAYLPAGCKNVNYREVCGGDLYALTFEK
ncbi:MAG: hypothetical protein LKK08_07670 [Bacteroidales bacterium]|nr:hypothetical protein [Bacteroidales bacterium]MCI2146097.1 hypothetical protein [Bacteroidales bacterium]